jgi:hypothetical protein
LLQSYKKLSLTTPNKTPTNTEEIKMNIAYATIKENSIESFPPLEMGFQLSEYVHKKHTQYIDDGTYTQILQTIQLTALVMYAIVKPLAIQAVRALTEVMDDYVQSSMSKEMENDHHNIIEETILDLIGEPSETLGQELTEESFTRRDLLLLAKTFGVKNYSRKTKTEIFEALKMQGNIPEKI